MGYFCINLDEDTKENLIKNIRCNLELYETTKSGYSYLLTGFIQTALDKLIVMAEQEEKLERDIWEAGREEREEKTKELKEKLALVKEANETSKG